MHTSRFKAFPLFVCAVVFAPQLIQTVLADGGVVVLTTRPAENLPPAVQEFASPLGAYRLSIQAETPTKLPGAPGKLFADFGSKSNCRLTRGTTVLWDKKLPFVMSDVIVTDQGLSIGVAYQHHSHESTDRTNHLLLVILDVTGERLLCEKHLREQSKKMVAFPVTPSYPDPNQIAVSPELDRVVFWFDEATQDCNRFVDVVFRVYELSTGDRKAIVYYDNINPQREARRCLDNVIPIVTPELLIVQHVHYRWPMEGISDKFVGESLELIDVQGKVVWRTQFDNPKIERDKSLRPMDRATPQHLHCSRVTSTKSGFVIENGATGKKDEYRVSKDKSCWVVSEVKPTTSSRSAP